MPKAGSARRKELFFSGILPASTFFGLLGCLASGIPVNIPSERHFHRASVRDTSYCDGRLGRRTSESCGPGICSTEAACADDPPAFLAVVTEGER
jgi:hypothetical protein